MSLNNVRIGFLGIAHVHAETYITCLQCNDSVALVGVFDSDQERLHQVHEKYGVPVYSNAEQLLEQKPQVLVVCSENMNHVKMVEIAARNGVDVLCEKPLAANVDDLERILMLERQYGIRIMTAFPNRYIHAYSKLQEAYRSNRFGKILGIKATNKGEMPGSWFIDKNLSGGGCLIDHTVHVADLLNNLFDSMPVTVNAFAGNRLYSGLGVEDVALVSWNYSNGVSVTLDSSWSRMPSFPYARDLSMHVVGTRDTCWINYFGESYKLYSSDQDKALLHYYGENKDQKMLDDLVGCYQEGREFPISSISGCRSALVAIAALRSVRLERPVSIDELMSPFLEEMLV